MAGHWSLDSTPHALLILLTVVIAVTALYGGLTSATVFGSYNPAWDGSTELRDMAADTGSEAEIVRNTAAYNLTDPSETIAFILSPDAGYSTAEAARIERFVRQGGTLIVAEDVDTHSNQLLADIGADTRFVGDALRDERFYEASPAMPVANTPTNATYTDGVSALALNHGTAIEPGNNTVLLNTSSYAYLDRNGNEALDDAETLQQYPVVTRERLGEGDVVAVSDPSIFINAMIDRRDNRRFAENLLDPHRVRLFDVSHLATLPPLVAARLFLQDTAAAQVALGGVLVLTIIYAGQLRVLVNRARKRDRSAEVAPEFIDASSVESWVDSRRPEWDGERVRRVSEIITQQNNKGEKDD